MNDDRHEKRTQSAVQSAESGKSEQLPMQIAGIIGGQARRVPDVAGRAADSMLAVYKQRLTYTFICDHDVASIHYDDTRREIFFRGHNIKFMALSETQNEALWGLAVVLANDREGERLAQGYQETLEMVLRDRQRP